MSRKENPGSMDRRLFLKKATLSLAAIGASIPLLQACASSPAPAPTSAPAAAPTTAPAAPAATSAPAAAATKAPAAAPTTAPAAPAATAKPAAGAVKKGGTLNIGQDFGPQSLDPHKQGAWASTNINELVLTGLLRWDKDMKPQPDLATSWENPEPTVYTFKLRKGVKFSNGREMVADDVKWTFDRLKDPKTAAVYAGQFAALDKVDVVDPQTVKFTLSRPFAPFLRYLATIPYGGILAKEGEAQLETKPISTGPFTVEEHMRDQYVKLKKNPNYYEEGLPYLDAVQFKLLGDDTSIASALRSGSIDITWLKDPKVAANVSKTTQGIQSVPGVSSRMIPIHFKLTEPPFNDVKVRQAMSLALDRKQIVDTVLGGYASVGTFLPPSQLGGYKGDGSDLPHYKRDVAKAKALLAEAGHPNGLKVPNYKVVAANALDVQAAQVMKEQWAGAGIDVTINPMEVGAIINDWNTGNYNMAMVGQVWNPDPDAEVLRFSSKSPFGKNMGINDPKMDELITKGASELNEANRLSIYKEITNLALDQVYVIVPYAYPLRWELVWDYVKGYEVMASNARMYVRQTWLNK